MNIDVWISVINQTDDIWDNVSNVESISEAV